LWDVTRRRWQVLLLCVEAGVGIALIATAAADSGRPIRDLLIGLVAGFTLGLSLVTPVDHSARRSATAGSGRRRAGGRRAAAQARWAHQPAIVTFASTPWPHPELTDQPEPTFAPRTR
jgi:hypothetical protein